VVREGASEPPPTTPEEDPLAPKPVCSKCNTEHWAFTKCEAAPEAAAREIELAAERQRQRVIPIYRDDPNWSAASQPGGLKF